MGLLFSMEKRQLWHDLIVAFQKGTFEGPEGSLQDGEGLLTRAWSDRTRGSRFKLTDGQTLPRIPGPSCWDLTWKGHYGDEISVCPSASPHKEAAEELRGVPSISSRLKRTSAPIRFL
ncbi:uncharacterized protein M8220_003005 [Acridotheres tristis]